MAAIMTMRPFFDVAPEISKNVPMPIGSVSEEGNSMRSRPTERSGWPPLRRATARPKAAALVAALKKAHPEKSIRTLSYMCSGGGLNSSPHTQSRHAHGHNEMQPEWRAGVHVVF